jgi:hypothetical protein
MIDEAGRGLLPRRKSDLERDRFDGATRVVIFPYASDAIAVHFAVNGAPLGSPYDALAPARAA